MPANSFTSERYVVYSMDPVHDDKSISSDRSGSIVFRDQDYVDLAGHKPPPAVCHGPTSPVPSTTTTDKWGSYWSKRERCCCFWNFLMAVSLIVLVTIVVLVSKGLMDIRVTDVAPSKDRLKDTGQTIFSTIDTQDDLSLSKCAETDSKSTTKVCRSDTCLRFSVGLLSKMNTSVDPCEDFYTYACGGYVANTRVSWTLPRRRINPDDLTDTYLETLVDRLSRDETQDDSDAVKAIKTVFKTCMDQHEGTDIADIREVVQSLGGFDLPYSIHTRKTNLTQLLVTVFTQFGVSPLFDLDIQPNGNIGITNRFSDAEIERRREEGKKIYRYRLLKPSDYIYRSESSDLLLQRYKTYIGEFVAYVAGINSTMKTDQRFVSMIDDLYHLNVYINRVFFSEDMTNYSHGMTRCTNHWTMEDVQYQFGYNMSWGDFFSGAFKNSSLQNKLNICFVSLADTINDILAEFSFSTLKNYIIFYTLTESDLYYVMPREVPRFDRPQWTDRYSWRGSQVSSHRDYQCVKHIVDFIPSEIILPDREFDILSNKFRTVFIDLVSSLRGIISDMYWVPMQQKQHLLLALKKIKINIGHDTRRCFSLQNVTSRHFINYLHLIKCDVWNILSGEKQTHLGEGTSNIFTLSGNSLDIPLLALHTLFSGSLNISDLWFDSMGIFMAQAISELFDIDALLRFLTDEKIDHRVALTIAFRLQCIVDKYNKYSLYKEGNEDFKVRGDLTKSANFKDSLALRIAFNTFSKRKRNADQRVIGFPFSQEEIFFLQYAQSMCESVDIRGMYRYYTDKDTPHHAPGKYRVLGTLSNFRQFSDAFKCPVGSSMNPEQKCFIL